jgi:hypothetical protein
MYRGGELELVKQKHFVRANGYVLKVGTVGSGAGSGVHLGGGSG